MCNSTGPHGHRQCSAQNIYSARYGPYGARYTRCSARCHSVISLMVLTTTSASHSFSHSGLCSSAPVAAGAASPSSCGLGSPSGVAPSGASSSFGAVPSPSCGAAAGASSSCGGAGASSSCAACAAAAGAGASSSCAAPAGASAGAAASAGPSSSCPGARGWAGGSPWCFFFFGVGGLDADILMVFGSGQRSSISSASYVSHHDCHLSYSSYALLLAENTWQLGMNSDQSSSSSSSSPCWLGLH